MVLFCWLTIFIVGITSCARITQGYKIDLISNSEFKQTATVAILTDSPNRDYEVIASFIGNEPSACKNEIEFCKLQELGKEYGADAALIQEYTQFHQPETWTFIQGKQLKLRAIDGSEYKGVFIRYKKSN